MQTARPIPVVLALALTLAACGDADMGEVSIQLATRPAPAEATGPTAATITVGGDEILLEGVQIVLRKLRLDGGPTASCPADDEGESQCASLRQGPVVFDLPLGEAAEPTFTVLLPAGAYDRMHFQIHKPSNANEDAELVAAHPEMEGVSIRAVGTYNGTPFVFTSDLTEVEQVPLAPAVEIAADAVLPLTLHTDIAGWFLDASGTGLVDPAEATEGGPYESEVERNIRESFRAFRDGDRNGVAD
jgi:hypothetical protein